MQSLPVAGLLALALALGGCASSATSPGSQPFSAASAGVAGSTQAGGGSASASPSGAAPRSAPTLPAGGVWLTDLGLTHGPAGFSVPADSWVVISVDQPNTVALITEAAQGPAMLAYLRANLAGMGFHITADHGDSLVFDDGAWTGAFTMTSQQAGLTLRHG